MCVVALTAQENRSYDGYGNNLYNKTWGAANADMPRVSSINYEDGIQIENDAHLPSPRVISNSLFDQEEFIFDSQNLSDFIWVFGQFIDHDITLVENSSHEPIFLDIPENDKHFSPNAAIITARSEIK
ncbi:MAG: peroxiredoxin, partial [Saprospiraceae bacterium]|nr:peroxiredoxin [Saprospiraceae bacterium]